ncbi:hypothetical protein MKX01_007575 [Papaver californicum]|nr:hypothetical protein MKX01_007575 [Papaver californicum]
MGLGKTLTLLSLISTDLCAPLQSSSFSSSQSLSTTPENLREEEDELTLSLSLVGKGSDNKKRKYSSEIVDSSHYKKIKKIVDFNSLFSEEDEVIPTKRRKTLIIYPQSHLSDWTKQLDQHTKPAGRNINDVNFLKYDVVLTTDDTLVHQSWVPFKDIEWRRSVPFLKTMIVWLVTGMPILNGSYNLHFAMDLLKFEPFSDFKYWQLLVQKLLDKGRRNEIPRLQLTPKTVETCFVDFSKEEREEYDQVEADSQNVIRNYMNHGSIVGNYACMLGITQRLRQLCNDSASCPSETLSAYCILKYLLTKQKKNKSPCCLMCRHPLSKTDLFSGSPDNPCNGGDDNGIAISTSSGGSGTTIYSSKVSALLNLLVASKNEICQQSLVFSQFRKMLILLEEPLKAAGFEAVKLDDHMKSTRKRNKLVEEFENMNSENLHIVLLADHKASNTCINLTYVAYLLEPWCNPEVKITTLITKNSIEERIMQLHEWKKNLRHEGSAENMDKRKIHREEFRILMAL